MLLLFVNTFIVNHLHYSLYMSWVEDGNKGYKMSRCQDIAAGIKEVQYMLKSKLIIDQYVAEINHFVCIILLHNFFFLAGKYSLHFIIYTSRTSWGLMSHT